MEVHAIGGTVDWDEGAFKDLLSDHGDVARYLLNVGEKVTREAKRLAPVSKKGSNGRPSGWLRSHIGHNIGSDAEGVYVDIYSAAKSPQDDPYGLFQEVGTYKMKAQPHLRPALDVIR